MSDESRDSPPHRFKLPKNKPMQMGDVAELIAEAQAAGEKIGINVPPPASLAHEVPQPQGRPEAEGSGASTDSATSRSRHIKTVAKPSTVKRRDVTLRLDAELVVKAQHHCLDQGILLRDAVERALRGYLK